MAKKKTKRKIKKLHEASSKCTVQGKPKFPEPIIRVTPQVLQKIRDITVNAGQFETGGLLLGDKKGDRDEYIISIKKATGPGEKAEFSNHHFKPDMDSYKNELKAELHLNGLVYLGEWHKHPGAFDTPSCTDLETMQDITEEDDTKDLVAIIATTPEQNNSKNSNQMVKTDFFYYRRGMKKFLPSIPEITVQPRLKRKIQKIGEINLDVDYVANIVENGNDELIVDGSLTDNKIANFLLNNTEQQIRAKLLLKNHNNKEIELNTSNEDLQIIISISPENVSATAWQNDSNSGDLVEIPVNMINLQQTLYKRLGGLHVKENIEDKTVTLLGLGSVGSAAAVQLVKAGINNLILIDSGQLKIHNIIRHVCDLSDLGRNKTDAVAEKLKWINPRVQIQKISKDFVEVFNEIEDQINNTQLLIISTDTAGSRNLANMTAVSMNIPAVFISLWERARTGTITRIVPGITGCRNCVGDGRWGSEMIPGTTDYSSAENERDIYFQPGLDTDISLVTNLGVKMAISTLVNPKSEVSPDLGTNFILWNGYPGNKQPMITLGKKLGLPKNIDCDLCGKI